MSKFRFDILPNFIDFEKTQDRFVLLQPDMEWVGTTELEVWEGIRDIKKIENEIDSMQINIPLIHPSPVLPFTP